ncbi:3-dehydroquinate synthase [Candidatus Blochmanniella floridana]|uniref:3-dehydroquinate synthase n=1 Tax=Blochmanniella floridana TaxID=203907 RepID=AROB_BLOFL|nr:RecName: Full=3-dehydroquinate synthase; Short=DHQS [Candidatus Blochmannia floridanus]CAD83253.1 3-dehydroquinate synthase [Candidatus Blochmannia floridanus]
MIKRIIVNVKTGSYPIIIGYGLLNKDFMSYWTIKNGDLVVIITNDRVAPIYLNRLYNSFNACEIVTDQCILPDGEQNKSLSMLNKILTQLLSKNYDRDTILVALGGGVIGDLTGFAASVYQRGIRFIQVPTTLLAQVDASIGGKTGVNHVFGKNMIGSFHQPISVMVDLDCLCTLSEKEFRSGLSEIIKYAVALDSAFFNWLENNLDYLLMLNPQSLMYCVYRCCELKRSIVIMDEFDQGIRSVLNLGHTYGHAIESYLGYSQWSHGEAIAAGLMMAVSTALHIGGLISFHDAIRIKLLLKRANLPICGPEEMKPQDYIKYMIRDKKSRLGRINLVLPKSIGKTQVFVNVNTDVILNAIENIDI